MKIATESAPNSQVVLNIEVDQDTVDRGVHRAYQRLSAKVRIPGFRPGKAPLPVVERHVGRTALLQEAIDMMLPEVFRRAVEETGIRPVAQPQFDLVQMEPLTLKATVDIEPTVQLSDYRALRIEPSTVEMTSADVDEAIEELRQQHVEHVPVERAVQSGDLVTLDVKMTAGERSLTDRQNIEYVVDAEDLNPIPGFAGHVVGAASGEERSFELTLPDDFEDKDLAGQQVQCIIAIHDVKETQLPPVDDSLARLHGEAETLVDLRAHLAQRLAVQREREAEERYAAEVVTRIVDEAKVEVPESLIVDDVNRTLERTVSRLGNQPLARQQLLQIIQQSGDELRAQLRPESERSIRTELVLDAVAAAENIDVSGEEITAEIEQLASNLDEQGDQFRDLASRPRAQESIGQGIRRRKARALLVQIARGEPAAAPPVVVTAPSAATGDQA